MMFRKFGGNARTALSSQEIVGFGRKTHFETGVHFACSLPHLRSGGFACFRGFLALSRRRRDSSPSENDFGSIRTPRDAPELRDARELDLLALGELHDGYSWF